MVIFPKQLESMCTEVLPSGNSAQRIIRIYASDGKVWVDTKDQKFQVISVNSTFMDTGGIQFSFNLFPQGVMR